MGSRAGRQQPPLGVWELPLAVPPKSQPLIVTIRTGGPQRICCLHCVAQVRASGWECSPGPDVGPCSDAPSPIVPTGNPA